MEKNFINVTPHAITLNNGVVFPTSRTVARVSNTFGSPDYDNVMNISYGNIEGLPEPADNTLYIVSAIVLSAAKEKGRTDCVAPATGHPDSGERGYLCPCGRRGFPSPHCFIVPLSIQTYPLE